MGGGKRWGARHGATRDMGLGAATP
eukprot:COSAG04_NODE_31795_length_255_cov_0.493590_1_plen_24_part_01